MKKLLMLLVFSASFFASAQTMTVVELTSTASDGRGTFGPHALHAIQGDDLSPYVYEGYTTSVRSYTLIQGVLTTPDDTYSTLGSFERVSRDFIYRLGLTGKFFNARTNEELEGVRLSSYHREPLFANLEANPDWGRDPLAPSYFERRDCGFIFQVAEIGPAYGHPRFMLTRNTDDGSNFEIIIARNFFDYPGTYFRTDADVIEAVERVLVDSGCAGCIGTNATLLEINTAIVAAESNYESQGNGTWIDRDVRPNGFLAATWNVIQIDGEQFTLEVGAGGDGTNGVRTSYDCLEELLDNLPQ